MPRRDARALLEDIIAASDAVTEMVRDRTLESYTGDFVIRSAVERQLIIVGEAVARVRDQDRALADRLGPVESIVGFRNILVHGYHMVAHEVVWSIALTDVPSIGTAAREAHRELRP